MNILNSLKKSTQRTRTENNREDYKMDVRSPVVRKRDLYDGRVKVEMFIPGLEPTSNHHLPRGGKIDVHFPKDNISLAMEATFVDEKKKTKTIFKFSVSRLPGKINSGESKWETEKGKIVLMLEKHPDDRNIDWEPMMLPKGLDQTHNTSSSDDDN